MSNGFTISASRSGVTATYALSSLAIGTGSNSVVAKTSAGFIQGWDFGNNGTTPVYVRIYDSATQPVPASAVPILRIMVPAGGKAALSLLVETPCLTGVAIAASGAPGDTDTTALSANQLMANLFFT